MQTPIQKIQFSDLDLLFTTHPTTKDLTLSLNEDAIKRSIKNLVLTKHYERPFHPEIGSNIYSMLFEPMSGLMSNFIETELFNTINNFEPRVKLNNIDVAVNYEENGYNVNISYYIKGKTDLVDMTLFLERLR